MIGHIKALFFCILCLALGGCSSLGLYDLLPKSHKALFWPQEKRDEAFRAAEDYTHVRIIKASSNPRPLAAGSQINLPIDLSGFIERQDIAGLIVLKDGEIRLEKYARGFDQNGRWTSFSVAKSITSTLAGAALKDGHIKSLDDAITQYIPNLTGTAYDGVTVRQLLTMTSGVKWNEAYWNPLSDVARFSLQKPEAGINQTVSYMRKLKRQSPPGTKWNYNTGETNLLGVLVSKAAGKNLSDYLSEKIWTPYGMQMDAIWALDETQHEMGGCCLSASLRDYARYGQFMLGGAKIAGKSVVPSGWIEQATGVQIRLGKRSGYGYQWWTFDGGAFQARGIFGQFIAVSPSDNLVVVMLSNWPRAWASKQTRRERQMFLWTVAKALEEK